LTEEIPPNCKWNIYSCSYFRTKSIKVFLRSQSRKPIHQLLHPNIFLATGSPASRVYKIDTFTVLPFLCLNKGLFFCKHISVCFVKSLYYSNTGRKKKFVHNFLKYIFESSAILNFYTFSIFLKLVSLFHIHN
jgi:hypothetical protein